MPSTVATSTVAEQAISLRFPSLGKMSKIAERFRYYLIRRTLHGQSLSALPRRYQIAAQQSAPTASGMTRDTFYYQITKWDARIVRPRNQFTMGGAGFGQSRMILRTKISPWYIAS